MDFRSVRLQPDHPDRSVRPDRPRPDLWRAALVAALVACACVSPALAQQPSALASDPPSVIPQAPASTDYVIGPQDVLLIISYDQADLSGKFTVEADGTFTYPFIGRVKAGGLTLRGVEQELKSRLKDGFFRDPQLSVAVEQYRSQRVFVIGEVRTPGAYMLTGDMSLIEALARAGSTLPGAGGEVLIVRPAGEPADRSDDRRGTDGGTNGPLLPDAAGSEVTRVDLKQLQSGQLSRNLALRDGDTIFVPRAESVYVFGQVRNPGAYPIQTGTTVLQALSLAGGVTDRGATGRVRVVRLVDGEEREMRVELGDQVQPGDTVIVPERFF